MIILFSLDLTSGLQRYYVPSIHVFSKYKVPACYLVFADLKIKATLAQYNINHLTNRPGEFDIVYQAALHQLFWFVKLRYSHLPQFPAQVLLFDRQKRLFINQIDCVPDYQV